MQIEEIGALEVERVLIEMQTMWTARVVHHSKESLIFKILLFKCKINKEFKEIIHFGI